VQFQPEERYWTEYLRIALPIIGLLLMIGLFWFWAQQLINDPSDPDGTSATQPPAGAAQLSGGDSTPEPTNPPVIGTNPAEGTTAPTDEPSSETPAADPPTEEPAADEDAEPDGAEEQPAAELAVGGFATVNDSGVNLRPNAALAGEPVATLDAETRVEIIGGPEEADEYTWWEVVVDGTGDTGFVAEDFLDPAP
jgi:cytoskeletal protein RodZ